MKFKIVKNLMTKMADNIFFVMLKSEYPCESRFGNRFIDLTNDRSNVINEKTRGK
jgi:hypothetical protein